MNTLRCLALGCLISTSLFAADAPAMPSSALPPPPPSTSKVSSAATPTATYAPPPIELSNPRGIAVDKNGVVYIGDINDGTVYKLTLDGKMSLLAGGGDKADADGMGKAAGFSSPTGLAVDQAGNVYVADGDSNTVRKITPAGVVTTFAGKAGEGGNVDGKGAAARFTGETALTVDKNGNIFVADTHNGTIRKITPDGTVTTLAPEKPAAPSKPADSAAKSSTPAKDAGVQLTSPRAIAVDAAGNIFVADEEQNIVAKVAMDGTPTVIAGDPTASGPSKDGVGTKAVLTTARGLAVDAKGNLYVADTEDAIIRKITPDGTVTTLAGSAGNSGFADGKGADARFSGPRGLAVDKDGNLYVADSDNGAVRKISPDGTVTTVYPPPMTKPASAQIR